MAETSMIISLSIIALAFCWLLYETKFLTVRLLITPETPTTEVTLHSISDILPIIFAAAIIMSLIKALDPDPLGSSIARAVNKILSPKIILKQYNVFLRR